MLDLPDGKRQRKQNTASRDGGRSAVRKRRRTSVQLKKNFALQGEEERTSRST